jgi:CBS domain containing-hemolysin-like protein
LHVVFGELAPKSVATLARAEGTALFVAPFMRFFYYLFWPGIMVCNRTANAVVRHFEKRPFAVRMPTLRISVLYE